MKVSVIIPAYNCAAYVADAVCSVTGQTERDLEVIVVDDGSTDDTLSIVRGLAAGDSRIKVITQANSGTPSVGRNRGIRAAQGEFVTFLDADDVCCAHKIERELRAFEICPELGVVFGDLAWFHDDPVAENNRGRLQELGIVSLAAEHLEHVGDTLYRCKAGFYNFMSTRITSINTQTVMVRRKLLLQEPYLFREDWRVGEDLDLWFRLARRAKVGYLNELLAYYRQRPGSLMRNDEQALLGSIRTHSANLERARDVLSTDEVRVLKRRLAQQQFHLGYIYFTVGRMHEAREAYRRARDFSAAHYSRLGIMKTYLPYFIVRRLRKVFGSSVPAEIS